MIQLRIIIQIIISLNATHNRSGGHSAIQVVFPSRSAMRNQTTAYCLLPTALIPMKFPKLLLTLAAITALNISVSFASAPQSVVTSPNGAVKIVVTQNESSPTYSISFNGAGVLNKSKTGLKFKDVDPGVGWSFVGTSERSQNETWTNRFGKKSQYVDHYNQITLVYANADMEFRYVFRAYDDAAAFRYEILLKKEQTYVVEEDLTQYSFPADFDVWTSNQGRFYTDQQQFFVKGKLSQIKEDAFDACPIVVQTPEFCAAITEAALVDWAGAQFASAKLGSTTLKTRLSPRKDKTAASLLQSRRRPRGASSCWAKRLSIWSTTPAPFSI